MFIWPTGSRRGNIQPDGSIDAVMPGTHLTAKISSNAISGRLQGGACAYSLELHKR